MKVTCIVGSARQNGSCAFLIDTFIKGLSKEVQVKKYCVGNMKMNYCLGCKKCYESG